MSLNEEDLFDRIAELVGAGYTVGLKHDERDDCEKVSVTAVSVNPDVNGYCLTGRGADLYTALKVVVYKHFVMLQGDWRNEVDRPEDTDMMG